MQRINIFNTFIISHYIKYKIYILYILFLIKFGVLNVQTFKIFEIQILIFNKI